MNPSKASNGSPMTELQLRLWCLWMCEEFADSDDGWAFIWAFEDTDDDMFDMMNAALMRFGPLTAWELSERMP